MRNPVDDFQDDGGTPMWRRRQHQTIDVAPPDWWRCLRRISFGRALLAVIFTGFALPFIVFFGGLLVAYLADKATDRWP